MHNVQHPKGAGGLRTVATDASYHIIVPTCPYAQRGGRRKQQTHQLFGQDPIGRGDEEVVAAEADTQKSRLGERGRRDELEKFIREEAIRNNPRVRRRADKLPEKLLMHGQVSRATPDHALTYECTSNIRKNSQTNMCSPIGTIDLVCGAANRVDHLGTVPHSAGGDLFAHVGVGRGDAVQQLLVGRGVNGAELVVGKRLVKLPDEVRDIHLVTVGGLAGGAGVELVLGGLGAPGKGDRGSLGRLEEGGTESMATLEATQCSETTVKQRSSRKFGAKSIRVRNGATFWRVRIQPSVMSTQVHAK